MALNEYGIDNGADDETIDPQEVLKKNLLFGNIGAQGPQVPPGQTAPINAPSPINDNIKAIQTPYTASSEAQPKGVNPIQGFLQKLSGGAQPASGGVDEYGLTKPQAAPNPGILSKILGIGLPAILGAKRGGAGMGLFGALSGISALGENAQKQYDTQLSEYQKNRALASTNQYHQQSLAQQAANAQATQELARANLEANKVNRADELGIKKGMLTVAQQNAAANTLKAQGQAAGSKIPAGKAMEIADMRTGIESIDPVIKTIEDNASKIGPIMGKIASMNPWDSNMQAIRGQVDLLRQIIGKGLEGGVLRKEDEIKYEKILGQVTNDPKAAIEKLKNVGKELKLKYNNSLDTLGDAGYNTSNFNKFATPISVPAGAIGKRKGSDGKLHFVDKDKNDLGVAE